MQPKPRDGGKGRGFVNLGTLQQKGKQPESGVARAIDPAVDFVARNEVTLEQAREHVAYLERQAAYDAQKLADTKAKSPRVNARIANLEDSLAGGKVPMKKRKVEGNDLESRAKEEMAVILKELLANPRTAKLAHELERGEKGSKLLQKLVADPEKADLATSLAEQLEMYDKMVRKLGSKTGGNPHRNARVQATLKKQQAISAIEPNAQDRSVENAFLQSRPYQVLARTGLTPQEIIDKNWKPHEVFEATGLNIKQIRKMVTPQSEVALKIWREENWKDNSPVQGE